MHAFALQICGDCGQIDARVLDARKDGAVCIARDGSARAVSVIGEGAQSRLRRRVHDPRHDQLLDIEEIGIRRILRARAGPRRSLWACTRLTQQAPARITESIAIARIGLAGVDDRDATGQRGSEP